MLSGKKIILGVCGSIAAYKAAFLTRLLVKAGAQVQCILTPAAANFIGPLTLSTLSKRPCLVNFTESESALWNNHVELGLWADMILIAPATAQSMAGFAHGLCPNLLSAVVLSARCPVAFAPAMDLDMWQHAATQTNVKTLLDQNHTIIQEESGELASGLVGAGRMAEPEHIVQFLNGFFTEKKLVNKKILISAGPTQEKIDPVRFISNHSSGRMGIALAESACKQGASVELVLGPTALRPKNKDIKLTLVKSAQEMFEAVQKSFSATDWCIMAAAVADYRPLAAADQKIKKKEGDWKIELERTADIIKSMGPQKKEHQLLIGFALESDKGLKEAERKLVSKNLDMIVLNSLADTGAGFGHLTNKITILDKHNNKTPFELKTKQAVAADILDYALKLSNKDS